MRHKKRREQQARYDEAFYDPRLFPMGCRLVFPTAEDEAEYKRGYKRGYNKRPEVKARKKIYMAAWRARPEVKAYEKAYRHAYRSIPEVQERDNALRKLRHARKAKKPLVP
jgi:hypothetical protein